jgi:hypothetical protein
MPGRVVYGRDARARVVDAEGRHRPAVVPPRQDEVHLVAAARPVLVRPEMPGVRIEHEALHVAMAVAVDLGQRVVPPDEGIVGRDAAVAVDAHDRARVAVEPLRVLAEIGAVAEPDDERAVRQEGHAPAVVQLRVARRSGGEQHLDVDEFSALEAAAHHARRIRAGRAVREGQVDPAVGGVVGIQHDLEQAGLAADKGLGHAAHRLFQQLPVRDDPQPSRALGDQHPAVRQERDGPGMLEALGQRLDPVLAGIRAAAGDQHDGAEQQARVRINMAGV